MSNYEDVYAPDLTEETESTLSGSEQFVMFDSVEGKRAELSTIADYIVANGEIDGSDIPTIVSNIEGSIGTLDTKVGDLTDLDTEDKDNLVAAINEVNGKAEDADAKADTVDEHVGDLSELETEDKTSAVDAINEVLSKIPVMTKEVTGNPIVVDDALNADVISLDVELEPVQDLHGYDKPWAAGAGKNKFDESTLVQGNWNYEGPNTPNNVVTHGYLPIKGGITYMWSQTEQVAGRYIRFYDANQEYDASGDVSQYNATNATFNAPQWAVYMRVLWYNVSSEITPDDIKALKPQIEEGSTATSWTPYSNICPITGHDSVTVGVTDGDTQSHSTTVTLPSTVYGGDVDVTDGEGQDTMANIASYNGETITEPWLSSMDEYSPGATPTTGAQVVYTLATPTDLSTTPTDITLYNGDNVVSSDGDMDMVYVRDIVKVIEKLEG